MIRTPLKVLVCLAIMSVVAGASVGWGYNGTGAPGAPAIQGDALSADPSVQPMPPVRTMDRSVTTRRPASSYSRRQSPIVGSTSSHTIIKTLFGQVLRSTDGRGHRNSGPAYGSPPGLLEQGHGTIRRTSWPAVLCKHLRRLAPKVCWTV